MKEQEPDQKEIESQDNQNYSQSNQYDIPPIKNNNSYQSKDVFQNQN